MLYSAVKLMRRSRTGSFCSNMIILIIIMLSIKYARAIFDKKIIQLSINPTLYLMTLLHIFNLVKGLRLYIYR